MPTEICEACSAPVDSADAYRAELTVGDMMCPSPMVFHRDCYEQAKHLWQPNPDSICVSDPEYPETQQWTPRPSAGA